MRLWRWFVVAVVFGALAALIAVTARDEEPTPTTWPSGDGDTVVIYPRAVP